MTRRLLALALAVPLLCGAAYDLPGTASTAYGADGDTDAGNRRVARDSNGFWYVVWDNSAQDVFLAYTTTTTPTAATAWATVTLVDSAGTGVIQATPAQDAHGVSPSLAMTRDDQLYVAWKYDLGTTVPSGYYSSKCSNLSALTVSASWATPARLDPGLSSSFNLTRRVSLALDERDVLHAAFVYDQNLQQIAYTKFDTASASWLTYVNLTYATGNEIALTTDLENNVYVAWRDSPGNIYLLASQDADTTNPDASTWKNLAQTTTDRDLVSAALGAAKGGPDCVVDRNGVLHVAWVDAGDNDPEHREGLIRDGWQAADADIATDTAKAVLKLAAAGNGDAYAFFATGSGGDADDIQRFVYTANTAYRAYGSWGTVAELETRGGDTSESVYTEHRLWPQGNAVMWVVYNDSANKLSSSWTNIPFSTPGWRAPRPTKNLDHPHLTWVFPNASGDVGAQFLPVVSQTGKSSVYVADNLSAGRLYALDRTLGTPARSYTCAGIPVQTIGATYLGNVHLFFQQNANGVMKLIDDGTALSFDAAWANNPLILGAAGIGTMLPPVFSVESSTRYVYALSDGAGAGGGLYKIKADNGVVLGTFPVGAETYQTNYLEPQFRFMNDQVFMAGNATQLYRRESDGTAEIVSSSVANLILHLLQVKGSDNNRLFLAPEDKAVWILSSGLKTTDWTGGQSANLGVQKTSGAYYTRYRNAVLVGAGNQLYRLNVTDGSIWANWPMATPGNIVSLPVEWRTFVYFGMDTGRLYAVNATTNVFRPNWPVVLDATASTPKPSQIAFDAVSGHVYFATNEGRVYKFVTE